MEENENKTSKLSKSRDPFEKVVLSKNIDNAILTSFRTLSKQNNVVTNTFKIVHDRFTPFNVTSGAIGPPVLATDIHTKRLRKLYNAKNH